MAQNQLNCPVLTSVGSSSNGGSHARLGCWSQPGRLAALVALAAILFRLGPLIFVGGSDRIMDPTTDSVGYVELAQGLRQGCGFVRAQNNNCFPLPRAERVREAQRSLAADDFPEIIRTPGYPLFLSLMPNLKTALVAQALLSGVIVFAVCAFASARWSLGAGLISSALIAFDIPSIVYCNEIMSDTLFTLLFVLGILSVLCAAGRGCSDMRKFAFVMLSSTFFGSAILVRPVGMVAIVAPAIVPIAFTSVPWRKRIAFIALLIMIPAITVVAWSLRNYRVTGVMYFSPEAGVNLFYYRAGGALTYASPAHTEVIPVPDQTDIFTQSFKIIAHHPGAFARMTVWSFLYLCVTPTHSPLKHMLGIRRSFPVEASASLRAQAALSALLTSPRETLRFLYGKEFDASPALAGLAIVQLGLSLILWIGVLVGLRCLDLRSYEGLCVMFCAMAAVALLLPMAGIEAQGRYRVPALPLLAILSGIGWMNLSLRGKT